MTKPLHDHSLRETRRRMLKLMGAATLLPLFGCGGAATTGTNGLSSCAVIPTETSGPYPADGTNQNGLDALTTSGIVRSDIRPSFGGYSGTAAGIPLTIELTLVDVANGCAPLADHAIYLWHCDIDGQYSLYTAANRNYLRGVQATDENGLVTFTSIFPAAYDGRWPHIHFEIFQSLAAATSGQNSLKISQMAMPKMACDLVYATAGYEASVQNLAKTSLSSDMVFKDKVTLQSPTILGDVGAGFEASIVIGV